MTTIQGVMDEYVKNTTDYYNQYVASNEQLQQAVQTQVQILHDKGADEANKYQSRVLLSAHASRLRASS